MWTNRWKIVTGHVTGGGQGEVLQVVQRDTGIKGALKRMHNDHLRVRERRARMFQEVTALKAINGCGCPRILESNAERWEEQDVALYLIMEWVDGPTLAHFVDRTLPTMDDAIAITRNLLCTVGACHRLGIFHRDLKPDNVIIDTISAPILVDFGMSWSRPEKNSTERKFRTQMGQEIGNRFLRLPEHAAGHHEYHGASDVTMVIGLLFYMLTRQIPRILTDASGAMPHERYASMIPAEVMRDPRWPRLRRIFDVGFQANLDRRFAAVEDVLTRLDNLLPPDANDLEAQALEELARLREITESGRGRELAAAAPIMLTASRRYLKIHHDALRDTGFVSGGSGPNMADGDQTAVFQFFLARQNSSEQLAHFYHTIRIEGGQFIATVRVEQEPAEDYYRGTASDSESLIEAVEFMAKRVIVKLFRYARERIATHYH